MCNLPRAVGEERKEAKEGSRRIGKLPIGKNIRCLIRLNMKFFGQPSIAIALFSE